MEALIPPDLALFVAASFAAALVAGAGGFAFGLVAAAVWLYILPPLQIRALIAVFGFLVQGIAVWKLRHALRPARLLPFLLGSVLGVPLGVELLRGAAPAHLRIGVGILLVAFSLYSLAR